MPLHLYPNIDAFGSVPLEWKLTAGKWQKVINAVKIGKLHEFEHGSGLPMKTAIHERAVSLETMRQHTHAPRRQKLEAIATLNLGILESLWSGVLDAEMAVARFYNFENCLYVRRQIKDATCDEIMSRGVQLGELLEVLPAAEAQRAFAQELETIRTFCLKLLSPDAHRSGNDRSKRSAVPPRA